MAALGILKELGAGQRVKLNDALVSGAGTIDFDVPVHGNGPDFSAVFQAVGTVTTLTASLQISLDGGTTFTDYIIAANFISNTVPLVKVTPLIAGARHRINITAATGSQDIWVGSN